MIDKLAVKKIGIKYKYLFFLLINIKQMKNIAYLNIVWYTKNIK